MLKRFLGVVLALMLALGLSGVAFAHYVDIEQDSSGYNFAFVGQHGMDRNIVHIRQEANSTCEANVALVVQSAPDCEAYIVQDQCNVVNLALVEQIDPATHIPVVDIQTKIHWAINEVCWGYGQIGGLVECLLGY